MACASQAEVGEEGLGEGDGAEEVGLELGADVLHSEGGGKLSESGYREYTGGVEKSARGNGRTYEISSTGPTPELLPMLLTRTSTRP